MPRKKKRSLAKKEQWRLRKENAKHDKCDKTDTSETIDHIPCEETSRASLRVSHSQPDLNYSVDGSGSQCLASSLMFLAHLQETGEVDRRNLDDVMSKGHLLYNQMRHQLQENKRSISKNLSIDDLPDTVETDHGHNIVIRSIPLSGLLQQDAPQDREDYFNLSLHLEGLGTAYPQALLMVGTLCISVFQERNGPFGFFYPHSHNADGSHSEKMENAVITFNTVTDLANGLMQFCSSLGLNSDKEYNLLPVVFMSRASEEDHNQAGSAMESKQKHVAQNSASQVLVSSNLELKIRRVSVRLTRLPENLDRLKDGNKLNSVWHMTYTEREGHLQSSENNLLSPKLEKIRTVSGKLTRRQEKLKELKERKELEGTQHKTDTEKEGRSGTYRIDPALRRRKYLRQRNRKNNPLYEAQKRRERDRYQLDADFRERRKQYYRDRYKNDPVVREKRKQRFKELYQKNRNNAVHREKRNQSSRDMYLNDSVYREKRKQSTRDTYLNNAVYRESLKQRSRDMYLNDSVYREKQKQRSRDKYQNDPDYRLKQKEYSRLRYQRKVTEKASQILNGGRNEEC